MSAEIETFDAINESTVRQISRNEKKSRKALSNLGLTKVENVNRATIKVQRTLLVLQRPEVFKTPSGESYVVFGDMQPQDLGAAMQQFLRQAAQAAPAAAAAAPAAAAAATEEDIETVMEQAGCSREKAIEALKKANNDPVEAIMHAQ